MAETANMGRLQWSEAGLRADGSRWEGRAQRTHCWRCLTLRSPVTKDASRREGQAGILGALPSQAIAFSGLPGWPERSSWVQAAVSLLW